MKKLGFVFMLILSFGSAYSQKYFSKNAVVRFHSDSPVEKIDALNSSGSTVIDMSSGKIEFAVLNNAFVFEKALMQEHFNENYMESTKFPKTVFKGTISDYNSIQLTKPGEYQATITGQLSMHGVTKDVSTTALFKVDTKSVQGVAKFNVKCSDYEIEIPALVKKNVSNDVSISVKVDYIPLKH